MPPGMDPPSLSSVRRLRRAASPEKQPRADDATLESAIVGATDDVAQILRHDALRSQGVCASRLLILESS